MKTVFAQYVLGGEICPKLKKNFELKKDVSISLETSDHSVSKRYNETQNVLFKKKKFLGPACINAR